MAARTVRPVCKTSSTSTTWRPFTSNGMSLGPIFGIGKRGRRVVPVEGDVDRPDGRRPSLDLCDLLGDPGRERHAATTNADERQVFDAGSRFENRHGDAPNASLDRVRIEYDLLGSSHVRGVCVKTVGASSLGERQAAIDGDQASRLPRLIENARR